MTAFIPGIDVYSRYQGNINWNAVKAAGIQVVSIKATNGSAKATSSPDAYVKGAKAAGLKVGLYAYATGVAGPVADANILLSEMKRLNCYDLAPLCDYEDSTLSPGNRNWLNQFYATLAKGGIANCYLYQSGSWWQSTPWWPNAQSMNLEGCTAWRVDAEYGTNNGALHTRTHVTGPVAGHQYTSVGVVSGVPSKVDRDAFYTVVPAKKPATPVAPVEDDMTPAEMLATKITYKSRATGQPVTCTIGDALCNAASLHEQYTKGYGGVGPAGVMANDILIPMYNTVNKTDATVSAINGSLPANQAAVIAAIQKQENGTAVDVNVTAADLTTALKAVLGDGFEVNVTPKVAQ